LAHSRLQINNSPEGLNEKLETGTQMPALQETQFNRGSVSE